MPAFNAAEFIGDAIESILNQTEKNFELIIINDGSTDATEEVVLSCPSPQIIYLKNETNLGNNASRNIGFQHAKGELIAIADADDISLPHRLGVQAAFMQANPSIDVLGAGITEFEVDLWRTLLFPQKHEYIAPSLFFKNQMAQPSLMLRKSSFAKHNLAYDAAWENMGDYELWYKAAKAGLRFANLQEVLVNYRLSPTQISTQKITDRNQKLKRHLALRLADLAIELPAPDLDLLHLFLRNRIALTYADYHRLLTILKEIETQNRKANLFPHTHFKAPLLYHRLRLNKYYHLEAQKSNAAFFSSSVKSILKAGVGAFMLFNKEQMG
ncbi:MAG: glycosyltransferase family A protein [Bacteroidetes bacterium]|nr:glycosyltransferase family A protein [Bacteroidota bacterium]